MRRYFRATRKRGKESLRFIGKPDVRGVAGMMGKVTWAKSIFGSDLIGMALIGMTRTANHSIQRMGASRSGQWRFEHQWLLAPTADADRLDRGGQLQRSDMFIVRETKQNRLKPHRGGMELPRAAHAAPMGLGRIVGRGVAINMSPRWGLALAGVDDGWPNQRVERMGASRSGQFQFVRHRRLAPTADAARWAESES